mgnify:CR=1 FL=1
MTYEILKKGLNLWRGISEKKEMVLKFQQLLATDPDKINVFEESLPLPKAILQTKLNTKLVELQNELNTLEQEFKNL